LGYETLGPATDLPILSPAMITSLSHDIFYFFFHWGWRRYLYFSGTRTDTDPLISICCSVSRRVSNSMNVFFCTSSLVLLRFPAEIMYLFQVLTIDLISSTSQTWRVKNRSFCSGPREEAPASRVAVGVLHHRQCILFA
jgi:hypothetical protein